MSTPAVASNATRISHHGHQRSLLRGRGRGKTAQSPKAPAGMVAERHMARRTSTVSGRGRERRNVRGLWNGPDGIRTGRHVEPYLSEQQRTPAGGAVPRSSEEQDSGEHQVHDRADRDRQPSEALVPAPVDPILAPERERSRLAFVQVNHVEAIASVWLLFPGEAFHVGERYQIVHLEAGPLCGRSPGNRHDPVSDSPATVHLGPQLPAGRLWCGKDNEIRGQGGDDERQRTAPDPPRLTAEEPASVTAKGRGRCR